ncbi:MAG: 30S ribosomal protein S16 [Planctomycetota bacterium]
MAVKIRMSRQGRRHRPFFRINVIDIRSPRDGRIVEKLGHYDPLEKNPEKEIILDLERVKYWLDKGAIPSDTVSEILLRKGIKHKYAEEKKVRRALARKRAKAKGVPFTSADRAAIKKAADAAKAAAEEKTKEEAKKAEEKAKEEKKEKPAEAAAPVEAPKEKAAEKKEEKPAEDTKAATTEEAPKEKPAKDAEEAPAEKKPEEKAKQEENEKPEAKA